MVNPAAMRVNDAVKEYDERLRFGFNQANGDWIVYILMPRDFDAAYYIEGQPVYPVLGVGTEIPHPEDILKRLYRADTLRNGEAILDKMNKDNDYLRKQRANEMAEFDEEMAERIEFELRKEGLSPITKVFFQLKGK
jgi:hypothetical protein